MLNAWAATKGAEATVVWQDQGRFVECACLPHGISIRVGDLLTGLPQGRSRVVNPVASVLHRFPNPHEMWEAWALVARDPSGWMPTEGTL